jgi:hypothetical protein
MMIDSTNLIVRTSGQKPGSYYIDYLGKYKISDISKELKVDAHKIEEIFVINGANLDAGTGIFYFNDIFKAKDSINALIAKIQINNRGRNINLSEAEIAQIRQALINDNSNLHINSKIKDKILKKLNG